MTAVPTGAEDAASIEFPATVDRSANLRQFMREQELTYINRALAQAGGDKEKAAQLLGVSLATLYRRLAEE